ncbi:DUF192 domain-containing protein [Chamaesiphon sp. VAR_69_metabat_338]|uniref:DUF192 domain-containing protein n=1 Tax=Chamaesiphon sp. VAR_69_metabat_338 TaxID=2964704 RepID=UPI00286E2998|nr:DUF192 domain-containing protein [Chamaesiphon sp. VAR_69_metabat_338]
MTRQQLKFGITIGMAGVLLWSFALPVRSASPFLHRDSAITRSRADLQSTQQGQKLPLSARFTTQGQTILLEVARTPEEQSTGLMSRTSLAADRGMLFVFAPARPASFWMKNTLIPLDMVFMSNGVVRHISANVPPCKVADCPGYGPQSQVKIDNVIELRAGRAAELKIKVGDRLTIDKYSAKILK